MLPGGALRSLPRFRARAFCARALLATALCSTSAQLSLAQNQTEEAALKGTYVVALAELVAATDLPASARPFLSALPRLVAEMLSQLPERRDDEAYVHEATERARLRARYAAGISLAQKLDELALRSLAPSIEESRRVAAIATARRGAEESRRALAALEGASAPPESGAGNGSALPQPTRPAALWTGNRDGGLFAPSPADPSALLREKGVSLFVRGRVEPLGAYALVELEGFDVALGRPLFTMREYADPADPEPLARTIAARIEEAVAGGSVGRLEIELKPPSARLFVDGRELDPSERVIYRTTPARIDVTATAPGWVGKRLTLGLAPGERTHLALDLEPISEGFALVETEPPDARLYLDGLPLGRAPAKVALDGRRAVLEASAMGYEPERTILSPTSGEGLRLVLRPDEGESAELRVDRAQRRFYDALGWLVLSLPASSLLYGASANHRIAYVQSASLDAYNAYITTTSAFAAAAAVSAALAVNAIIRLAGYITAAR